MGRSFGCQIAGSKIAASDQPAGEDGVPDLFGQFMWSFICVWFVVPAFLFRMLWYGRGVDFCFPESAKKEFNSEATMRLIRKGLQRESTLLFARCEAGAVENEDGSGDEEAGGKHPSDKPPPPPGGVVFTREEIEQGTVGLADFLVRPVEEADVERCSALLSRERSSRLNRPHKQGPDDADDDDVCLKNCVIVEKIAPNYTVEIANHYEDRVAAWNARAAMAAGRNGARKNGFSDWSDHPQCTPPSHSCREIVLRVLRVRYLVENVPAGTAGPPNSPPKKSSDAAVKEDGPFGAIGNSSSKLLAVRGGTNAGRDADGKPKSAEAPVAHLLEEVEELHSVVMCGTMHVSEATTRDVKNALYRAQAHAVLVELDETRFEEILEADFSSQITGENLAALKAENTGTLSKDKKKKVLEQAAAVAAAKKEKKKEEEEGATETKKGKKYKKGTSSTLLTAKKEPNEAEKKTAEEAQKDDANKLDAVRKGPGLATGPKNGLLKHTRMLFFKENLAENFVWVPRKTAATDELGDGDGAQGCQTTGDAPTGDGDAAATAATAATGERSEEKPQPKKAEMQGGSSVGGSGGLTAVAARLFGAGTRHGSGGKPLGSFASLFGSYGGVATDAGGADEVVVNGGVAARANTDPADPEAVVTVSLPEPSEKGSSPRPSRAEGSRDQVLDPETMNSVELNETLTKLREEVSQLQKRRRGSRRSKDSRSKSRFSKTPTLNSEERKVVARFRGIGAHASWNNLVTPEAKVNGGDILGVVGPVKMEALEKLLAIGHSVEEFLKGAPAYSVPASVGFTNSASGKAFARVRARSQSSVASQVPFRRGGGKKRSLSSGGKPQVPGPQSQRSGGGSGIFEEQPAPGSSVINPPSGGPAGAYGAPIRNSVPPHKHTLCSCAVEYSRPFIGDDRRCDDGGHPQCGECS